MKTIMETYGELKNKCADLEEKLEAANKEIAFLPEMREKIKHLKKELSQAEDLKQVLAKEAIAYKEENANLKNALDTYLPLLNSTVAEREKFKEEIKQLREAVPGDVKNKLKSLISTAVRVSDETEAFECSGLENDLLATIGSLLKKAAEGDPQLREAVPGDVEELIDKIVSISCDWSRSLSDCDYESLNQARELLKATIGAMLRKTAEEGFKKGYSIANGDYITNKRYTEEGLNKAAKAYAEGISNVES